MNWIISSRFYVHTIYLYLGRKCIIKIFKFRLKTVSRTEQFEACFEHYPVINIHNF